MGPCMPVVLTRLMLDRLIPADGLCMLAYYTSASATVPQPGPQATGTSGHCLCHLLGTAEELGEAAQAPE
jgi:hypothetical protein